ncbi:MAG TPA: hypothetical protein VHC70_13020 [Phycisphaerales bacterium]|nr:hypothetical protein [Phycisphaerales bacterium]
MAEETQISIRPSGREWSAMLAADGDARSRRFREELGLPVDRPVIVSGHQAQVWHPGILAKAMASRAAADRVGGAGGERAAFVWLVVDQDDHEPFEVRYPVRLADGRLERRVWRMDGGAGLAGHEHVPTANRAIARRVTAPSLAPGEAFASAGVGAGLERIAGAMRGREGEASAARQVALATMDLMREVCPADAVVFATAIARTTLFAEVVARLRADARAARESYNAAVREHPGAGVAELAADELPLWHVPAKIGAARRKVTAAMLGSAPATELAPRALLMTGLMRWAGGDLFVHGLGGAGADGAGGYDCITSRWLKDWLGAALAPTAMVTATVRLEIPAPGGAITPEQIARARWVAHSARHRPSLLGDSQAEAARGEAVATLRRLRWKRDAASKRLKLEAYRGLHRTLEGVRARRAADLARLEAEAASAASRREEAEIIADRTWAWPLYEAGQIAGLRGAIEREFE